MLPTQKTPPRSNLSDLTVFIYGPHKFGKSKWCSQIDDALFLATEPGLNSLNVFQQPIRSWDELLLAAKEIADGKHSFRAIVIDTVDNAYRMCAEYICHKFKIEHESDLEYGKGYSLINNEFHRVLNKLALLPHGLFLVSHSQDKEVETRTGKYTASVPTLPDKVRKLVLGMVDIILFCDLERLSAPSEAPVYRRVVRTKPSTTYLAGDRTGRLPEVIDLDFVAFVAAFGQGAGSTAPASAGASPAVVPSVSPGGDPAGDAPATSTTTPPSPEASAPVAPASAGAPVPPASAAAPPAPEAAGPTPRASTSPTRTTPPARSVTSPAKPRPAAPQR